MSIHEFGGERGADLSAHAGRRVPAWAAVAAVCGLSILVKAGLLVALGRWGTPQVWEYEPIAVHLSRGEGYRSIFLEQPYRSEVQPLYPLLCAAIYRLFGHHHALVQLVQIVLGVLLCLVAYDLGRRLWSRAAGLGAAGLIAVHPGLAYYATANLHVLMLDALLFAAAVWALIRVEARPSTGRAVTAGGLIGLALLSRASVLAFVPFGFIWLLWRLRDRLDWRRLIARLAVMAATAALMVAPWLIRNDRLHGRPFYFLSTVGSGLWTGNNPHASGSTLTPDGRPILSTAPPAFLERLYQLPEAEQDAMFYREARAFITAHPDQAARLYLRKLIAFWWFSPQSGLWYPKRWLVMYQWMYTAMVLLAVAGFVAVWRRGPRGLVIVLPVFALAISLCQSLYYVEGRHRWEVEALMLVLAGIGLVEVGRWSLTGAVPAPQP